MGPENKGYESLPEIVPLYRISSSEIVLDAASNVVANARELGRRYYKKEIKLVAILAIAGACQAATPEPTPTQEPTSTPAPTATWTPEPTTTATAIAINKPEAAATVTFVPTPEASPPVRELDLSQIMEILNAQEDLVTNRNLLPRITLDSQFNHIPKDELPRNVKAPVIFIGEDPVRKEIGANIIPDIKIENSRFALGGFRLENTEGGVELHVVGGLFKEWGIIPNEETKDKYIIVEGPGNTWKVIGRVAFQAGPLYDGETVATGMVVINLSKNPEGPKDNKNAQYWFVGQLFRDWSLEEILEIIKPGDFVILSFLSDRDTRKVQVDQNEVPLVGGIGIVRTNAGKAQDIKAALGDKLPMSTFPRY